MTRTGLVRALLPLALLLPVLAGAPAAAASARPDVLLVTIDTLRADAPGFAGNRRVATPHLDRLAAGGRVFANTHAHNVVTLPSHANILTGLYPYQHGVRDNLGFALPADVPTLATVLRAAGYADRRLRRRLSSRLALRPRPRLRRLRRPHHGGRRRRGAHARRASRQRGGGGGARLVAEAARQAALPLGAPLRPAHQLRAARAVRHALRCRALPRRGGGRRRLPGAAAAAAPRRARAAVRRRPHRRPRRGARRPRRGRRTASSLTRRRCGCRWCCGGAG